MKRNRILPLLLLVALCLPFVPSSRAESVNLVRGMAYTVQNSVSTEHSYSNYSDGTEYDPEDGQTVAGKLTDGVYAGSSVSDSAWYRSFRSRSRYITFSFDSAVSVEGFSASFFHSKSSAYYAPRYVNLYLSDDGETFSLVGMVEPDFSLNSSDRRYTAKLSVEPYAATYVRIEFCCDIFVCCDEIEVYGSRTLSGNEKAIPTAQTENASYCSSLSGITDVIKLYNGYYPASQEIAQNTVEELLPYVAYLSADGEVTDTMFDAVAFVPCVSTDFAYPSGGTLVRTSKYPSAVQSDWIYYTDFLFAKGYDLDALNTAVKQVYETLGIEGKFPVLLTMPYAGVTDGVFGDLDGDGTDEFCRTAAERIAVIQWYDEYLTSRFESANFSHIEFVGYYWYGEEVNYSWSADEEAFTVGATAVLRERGKEVLFDPFYLSTGFDMWEKLGFTGAVMQPNVAFTEDRAYFDTEMLWEFAETIRQYNLGTEIETNEPGYFRNASTMDEAIQNYERYLYVGSQTGYMDALHTFYQGAGPGTLYDFCHADTSTVSGIRLRRLYDITYQFIKGSYENLPPTVELPAEATAQMDTRVSIPISVTDVDSYSGDLKIEVLRCEHGKAQIAATKKTLFYLPDSGFVGTDTVHISVTDGQNGTAEYEITVHVAAETAEIPSAVSDSSGNAAPAPSSDASFPWYLVVASALAVAVLAVLLLLKKRK